MSKPLTPHPDSLKRRNGWRITPPVTRMMSEAVKLHAVLRTSCHSSVDETLQFALPIAIKSLRNRCRARGINPDRVIELTVCKIDERARNRDRLKLNPPQAPQKPATNSPKIPRKVEPIDYTAAPMRDLPDDDTK